MAIRASRGVAYGIKVLQTADCVIDTAQAVNSAGEEFGKGNIGMGLLNTGFALLGAKGASESFKGLNKLDDLNAGNGTAKYFKEGYDTLSQDAEKIKKFASGASEYGKAFGRGWSKAGNGTYLGSGGGGLQKLYDKTIGGFNEIAKTKAGRALNDAGSEVKLLGKGESLGYTKVDYENFDLAQKAWDYRKGSKYWSSDANIGVVEFIEGGVLRTKTIKSINPMNVSVGSQFGHSEKLLLENLQAEGIDLNSVTRLFTERSLCNRCDRIIQSQIPNADVFYSFDYKSDGVMKDTLDLLRSSLGLTQKGDLRKR